MEHTSMAQWDVDPTHLRKHGHVDFNVFPDVKGFAATERADVMTPLDQDTVFQTLPDGSGVVLDSS
jgi:hypothetical protein